MSDTGFTTLDKLVKSGGFAKGELMVFMAKPSTERKSMVLPYINYEFQMTQLELESK